jgi:asparagine synthase (glutamine-hydrolysing)
VSAIAGCYWRDRRPARVEDVKVSADAAAHRASGPFHFWCAGPIALAYGGPDNHDRAQPLYDPSSRTAIIFDGRLDNLDELAGALCTRPDTCTVALAAYHRWGAEAGAHLLGDFVMVAADARDERLLCIRDPMGQRPLFYGSGPRGIVFASELQQIVRHPAMRPEVNEGMVAEYLCDMPTTIEETLWRHIHRLPPAHALEISAAGSRVQRYWDFDPDARVQHATPDGYAHEFIDLFTRAVSCRIRDAGMVGVFLSGGIDSSAIAGVSHALRSRASRPPVHAFSLAFPDRPCDETPYSNAVIAAWRLPATRLNATTPSRDEVEADAARYLDVPAYPNGLVLDALRRRAKATRADVLLTGYGGDDFFSGTSRSLVDLLRPRRVLGSARSLVNPWLSTRMRRLLTPLFGSPSASRPWIRPELARAVSLEDRLRARRTPSFPTREQRDMVAMATGLSQVLGDEMEDRAAHAAGIDQRHPFYDRRLAELGLALPSAERGRGGRFKLLVRRALRDYLPPAVAARIDKAEFSSTYVETLEALGGRQAFDRLKTEEAGWVDGSAARQMYDRMIALYSRGDAAYIPLTGPLWAIAALETWLESVNSMGSMISTKGASIGRSA